MNQFVFLALAALVALGDASSTITDCGKTNALFVVDGLAYWPDPPVPGQNGTLSFLYTVPDGTEAITDGSAKYSITLNGIPFPATTDPLCDDVPCPLVPGTFNLTSTSEFPTGVSGKISSKIQWYDTSKTELLCVDLTVRI
jgi:hypothetical protein